MQTRFSALLRWQAAAVLAIFAALTLYGVGFNLSRALNPPPPAKSTAETGDDIGLYHRILARVRAGENYEAAAVDEQRREGYPVRPFVTVRPPALAVASAHLPPGADLAGMEGMIVLIIGVFAWRLRAANLSLLPYAFCVGLFILNLRPLAQTPELAGVHEVWAGLLIALSLGLWGRRSWCWALPPGIAAGLVREFAIGYLVVMAGMALCERRRGEALAWTGGLLLCLAALAAHAHAVEARLHAHEFTSLGWLALGGWPFLLTTSHWSGLVVSAPAADCLILPVLLLGLLASQTPLAARALLFIGGCGAVFLVIGRPDNGYWGLVYAPLLPLGVAAVGPGAKQLLAALTSGVPHRPKARSLAGVKVSVLS